MSWTVALFTVWMFITMINTLNWWSGPMKFSFNKSTSQNLKSNNWLWLQDGRINKQ